MYLYPLVIVAYLGILFLISLITSKKDDTNDAFFSGHHRSPWWVVSIGMIGASISGVSFVSVPGMVGNIGFAYMQMVIGFFFGYWIIAEVLLPLYYQRNLTSIYTYINERFGRRSYLTSSSFFLLSKLIGASARLYLASFILQKMVMDQLQIPFYVTLGLILLVIWLYTFKAGVKTIVWTDSLQTLVMLSVLIAMVVFLMSKLNLNVPDLLNSMQSSELTRCWHFEEPNSKLFFWKQFLSGMFISIVMTGLDQDMMQKNLSCRSLKDAKRNMYWYGFAFIPFNLVFLTLGYLLIIYANANGIELPTAGDEILPFFASNHLGELVGVLFVVGILSASLSSADSALTALTTTFSIDILGMKTDDKINSSLRKKIHIGMTVILFLIILGMDTINDRSVIDLIYTLASYSYGPLLGLFAAGMFTNAIPRDKWIPFIAILSPFLTEFVKQLIEYYTNYQVGYELLLINGMITFTGVKLISIRPN